MSSENSTSNSNLIQRPRRLRRTPGLRSMVRENQLTVDDLIYPMFVMEGENQKVEISSMPGCYRYTLDLLLEEIKQISELGINAVALFPLIPEAKKDDVGTESYNPDGLVQRTVKAIKQAVPDIVVITDVALDPFSIHGHDGIVDDNGVILNDPTVEILVKMAVSQAEAGTDIVAPSDMMDGRVGYIRNVLDQAGYTQVSIMSYTAKYASAFYGPFRDALDSAPKFVDKKTYQMNPANSSEALIEADLDIEEGADMIMVKPGMPYLDIISYVSQAFQLPTFAYHVSGEYAMLKAAAEKGWIDYEEGLAETLLSFKRAGCTGILTYGALDFARMFNNS